MRDRPPRPLNSDAPETGLTVEIHFEGAAVRDEAEVISELHALLSNATLGRFSVRAVPSRSSPSDSMREALQRGEARLVQWTEDGTLVPGSTVERAWGIRRQSVDAARNRRELVSIYAKGQHWYPAEILKLERPVLKRIVKALGEQPPSSLILFFMRRHPALSNLTIAEAVARGKMMDVVQLAETSRSA